MSYLSVVNRNPYKVITLNGMSISCDDLVDQLDDIIDSYPLNRVVSAELKGHYMSTKKFKDKTLGSLRNTLCGSNFMVDKEILGVEIAFKPIKE